MEYVDACHVLEQFACEMDRRACTGGRESEFAGLFFGERHQFIHGGCRYAGAHHQQLRRVGDETDDRQIACYVIGQFFVQRRVYRESAGRAEQQGVTVRRGLDRGFNGNRAAGAGAVVDDHAFAPEVGELLREHAADQVGRAARRERHQHAHRAFRISIGGDCRAQAERYAAGEKQFDHWVKW